MFASHSKFFLPLLVLCLLLAFQCEKDKNPLNPVFSGIAKTDDQANLIEDDPDDWQPRCGAPAPFCARPAYPNPTQGSTSIHFALSSGIPVKIVIHSPFNRIVRTLIDTSFSPGTYNVAWDLRNDAGELLPSGIYRVYIEAGIQTHGDIQIQR